MRTKELRPNTRYATEAGTLVVTGDTVERGWYRFKRGNSADTEVAFGLPGDEKPVLDPWADSGRQRQRVRLPDGTWLRDVVEGVRVTAHQVDHDGEPVRDGQDSVVDPKHIKGTWEDYLRLHGDKVRSSALRKEAEARAAAEQKRLSELARGEGLKAEIRVSVEYAIKDAKGERKWKGYLSHGESFEEFRLVPTLQAEGEWVESLLAAWLERGH